MPGGQGVRGSGWAVYKGLQVWIPLTTSSTQIPFVAFYKNIVPASFIWSRGHHALDWSLHSKEVVHSGDNIFTRDRLVSGHQ